MGEAAPFEFKACASILKSTGKKAKNLRELRDIIAVVGDGSIFHHTYHYFIKRQVFEYTNDFAHWAGEGLEERALSEHLSNIDPYAFKSINDLRQALLDVIDGYLSQFPEPRDAIRGGEFYFNETVTMIFPAGIRAKDLKGFLNAVKRIDGSSIYYHFFEARVRLGVDDFSKWIEDALGKKELSERLRAIDLFMHRLEGIRKRIADAVTQEILG